MEEQRLTKKERQEQARQEKLEERAKDERGAMMKKFILAAIIIGVTVGVIILIASTRESITDVVNVSPDPSYGAEDATVVVKEYGDFQCPACAGVQPVVKDLLEEFGDRVRFEFNDFPLPNHDHAQMAAVAAQCAFEQDKFFEFHDLLYENQGDWGPENATEEEAMDMMIGYANNIGLNEQAFLDCTTQQEIADRVQEDFNEARDLGINSTPTFFVNEKIVTDPPYSISLRAAIEEALGETGVGSEAQKVLEEGTLDTKDTGSIPIGSVDEDGEESINE